jgi:hypothetical protein
MASKDLGATGWAKVPYVGPIQAAPTAGSSYRARWRGRWELARTATASGTPKEADHGAGHQATDEEAGVPGVGHYRDRDRHLGGGADLGHVHEAIDEEAVGGGES